MVSHCRNFKIQILNNHWLVSVKVVWLSFFLTLRCSKMMCSWGHFACSCILVGRETQVGLECPTCAVKRKGKRKEKWHQPQDGKWTLIIKWLVCPGTNNYCYYFVSGVQYSKSCVQCTKMIYKDCELWCK